MTFIVPDSNNENNDGNNSEYYSESENNTINYENVNPIRLGNSNTIPSNDGNNKKNNNESNEEFHNARTNHNIIEETAFENIKISKNKVNHFFLELYKIKSEYNDEVIKNNSNQNKLKLLKDEFKNKFKNKLFSYKYRICQTNLDNKFHSFFLMSDKKNTFSVGVSYIKDVNNKDKDKYRLIIKTNDIIKEEYCGIDYLYEFEINDENQMPINTDLKNLINDDTCRKTGLLLPFMWNYIDKFYISNEISTSKNINEYQKDKLYIICTKELYNNDQNTDNKIIIDDNIIEQLKNIDLNNENTAKIKYSTGIMNKIKQLGNREYSVSNLNLKMMTDIEYKEFSPTIKQASEIDVLNCREYVMRMFGMDIINRLLEKSKSRKEEIDMIKEKHKHKIISEIIKNIPNLNLKYSDTEELYELISKYDKDFKNRYSLLNASEIRDVFNKLKKEIYQKSQNNKKKINQIERLIDNKSYIYRQTFNPKQINPTLIDLYLLKINNDAEGFKKRLYECRYRICDLAIIKSIINQYIRKITHITKKKLNKLYENKDIKFVKKFFENMYQHILKYFKKGSQAHSFFMMYDPKYNNINSIGLTYYEEDNEIALYSPDNPNCSNKISDFFKLDDIIQEDININLKDLISKNICYTKGLLVPFFWNYIENLYVHIRDEEKIFENNNKDEKIVKINKLMELYEDDKEIIEEIGFISKGIQYDLFKTIKSIYDDRLSTTNCQELVYKLFGRKILKKINFGKVFVKQDYEKAQQRLNEENIPFDKIQQIARKIAKKIKQKYIENPDFLNKLMTNNFMNTYNNEKIIQSGENHNLLKKQIREEYEKIYKAKFMNEKIRNLKGFSNKNINNTLKLIRNISPIITNNNINLLKKSIKFRQGQDKKQRKTYINKTINEINKLENGSENMIRTLQNLKNIKKITEKNRQHMNKELNKRITKRYKKEKSEKRKKYIKNKVKKVSNTVKRVMKKGKNTMSKLKNKIVHRKKIKKLKKTKKKNKKNKKIPHYIYNPMYNPQLTKNHK